MSRITCMFLLMVWMPASHIYSQPFKKYTPLSTGIGISFYKNVEFAGFVFFLGSQYMGELYEDSDEFISPGIKRKDWFAYDLSLYKKYKHFKGNKDLKVATQFAEQLQGSDLIRLVIGLKEFPETTIPAELPLSEYSMFSEKRDSAEARQNLELFIESLNRFYKEVDFDQYFRQSNHLYEQAMNEIKASLPSNKLVKETERFYRQRFESYTLLPSLTLPSGMAFGVSYTRRGKTAIFNAFGPFAIQQFSSKPFNMGFDDKKHIRELSVHEFGHSFTNPVLDRIPANLISQTAVLFDTVKTAMENQGYNNWMSCVYEHFVRAGEVIIARNLGHTADAEKLLADYVNGRKFIYLPVVIEELQKYNHDAGISYEQAAIRVLERWRRDAKPAK